MTVYAGSDGQFYTDWEVMRRFESGHWRACMWDEDDDWEVVEADGELVWLVPVENATLPEGVEVHSDGEAVQVIDRRPGSD